MAKPAAESSLSGNGNTNGNGSEARYVRVMPWLLIGLGALLAITVILIRTKQETTTTVTTSTAPAAKAPSPPSPPKPKAKRKRAAKRVGNPPDDNPVKLQPASSTETKQPISDTVFGSLIGISALLVLLGAFYSRISKFSVAGNEVVLTPAGAPQDAKAISAAVSEAIVAKLRKSGQLSDEAADQAKEIAEQSAEAAAELQQEIERVRLSRASLITTGTKKLVRVDPAEVGISSGGLPFSEDVLARLAKHAAEAKVTSGEDAPATEGTPEAEGRGDQTT